MSLHVYVIEPAISPSEIEVCMQMETGLVLTASQAGVGRSVIRQEGGRLARQLGFAMPEAGPPQLQGSHHCLDKCA